MIVREIAAELGLRYRETVDWANALERSILLGHVKRPASDVSIMRWRFPAFLAGVHAVEAIERWRDRLPAEFLAEIERDPT